MTENLPLWETLTEDQLERAVDSYDPLWGHNFHGIEDAASFYENQPDFERACQDILDEDEDAEDEE